MRSPSGRPVSESHAKHFSAGLVRVDQRSCINLIPLGLGDSFCMDVLNPVLCPTGAQPFAEDGLSRTSLHRGRDRLLNERHGPSPSFHDASMVRMKAGLSSVGGTIRRTSASRLIVVPVALRRASCRFVASGAGAGLPGCLVGEAILVVVAMVSVILYAGVPGLSPSAMAVVATTSADLGHVLAVTADGLAAASPGFTGLA